MKKLVVLIGFLGLIGSAIGMGVPTADRLMNLPGDVLGEIGNKLDVEDFLRFIQEVPQGKRVDVAKSYLFSNPHSSVLVRALDAENHTAIEVIMVAIKNSEDLARIKLFLNQLHWYGDLRATTALMETARENP